MRQRRTKILAAVAATAAMVATSLPVGSPTPVSAAGPTVFINELHYDNADADAGEAVEIAGPAGTDLQDWSVVLYNGNGGTVYDTINLSGSIPDQQSGFGASSFARAGIQNGSPDGLALVDATGAVIEFLSYEGSFTAVGGPAGGLTSTDIGVSEARDSNAGDSLQLTGTGTMGGDFVWAESQPSTFGAVNTGQTFVAGEPPVPADPVVNEFSASTAGTDVEYVEIFGAPATDYSSLTVLEIEGDNSGDGTAVGTIDEVIPVGSTDSDGLFLAALPANSLENGSITLLLVDGFDGALGTDLDTDNDGTLDATPWVSVVDGIAVNDGGAGDATYAVALTPDYDGLSSFAPGGASRMPDGADTDTADDWIRNDFDLAGIPGNVGTPVVGEVLNTPGAPNQVVDVAPPDPCLETTPIADVQGPDDVSPFAGQEVTISGLVTADFGSQIVVQDGPSAPRAGVVVFSSGNGASVGDDVCVTGVASERFGQTQVGGNGNPDATIEVLTAGNALPEPATVTTAEIATGSPTAEDYEGVLVRVENVTVAEILRFGEFSVDDGSGAARVDDLGAATYTPTVGQALDFVQGPLFYTFFDYKIEPRDDADIGVTVVPEVCGDPATFIHDIQGSGAVTPIPGQTVSIEGVVVGDFQDTVGANGDLNGFYVQEEDSDADGDPSTSEGIFVFQGSNPAVDVAVGDLVRVRGTAVEFETSRGASSETQLSGVTVLPCDADVPTPAATVVQLPIASLELWEIYEGMLLTFPQDLTISEYFNYDRFGEVVLTDGRLYQPTAVFDPGTAEAAALDDLNDRSKITLDDGLSVQNPEMVRHPDGSEFTLDNRFRGGDLLTGTTGVLGDTFGLYRIQPTTGARYTPVNERPEEPEDVGGNVSVASFNVLNYFKTPDGNGSICGPDQNQGCRGADNEDERIRQLAKIVAAIDVIDADVVGIIEVENTTGVEALADIVDGLNELAGEDRYAYIETGTVGGDAIKVGLLYQPGEVTPVGDYAVLDDPAFVAPFGQERNRAALAQTFIDDEDGGVFTVAVNHLKSKGSTCGDGDDDPEAGSCNLTRTVAAQVLADWLAGDPTGSGDPDVLIVGDLNSYDKEDPIDVLQAAGYSDLLDVYQGEFAYSYLFSAELGYLDYVMANMSLATQVTGATAWHTNADEPDILDYDTTFKSDTQDALYEPNPYRASDHDAVIVGLEVCDTIAPSISVSVTPEVLSPPNGKYRTVEATVVASDNFDPDPTVTLVSVTSDEPDDGVGDGNTVDDIVIVDDDTFRLRAERSGTGDGRTYTITYRVEDDCGNTATASATVEVPKGRDDRNG